MVGIRHDAVQAGSGGDQELHQDFDVVDDGGAETVEVPETAL